MTAHFGIDLSSYQGVPSLASLRQLHAGNAVDFAYVKVTEGTDYTNPDARAQVEVLREAGIYVGLYHFLTPTAPIPEQVDDFLLTAQGLGGSDLPLALDSETAAPGGWPTLANDMVAFAMQVENEPTVVRCPKAMFYVNLSFYRALDGFPWGRLVWLADPNPGAPHEPCLVLQGSPRPEGEFANVDPDLFMGDDAQWAAFVSAGAAPVAKPPTVATPVAAPASPAAPAPAPTETEFDVSTLPNLGPGNTGPLVKSLQLLLIGKANQLQLGANGNYGVETEGAVRAVQSLFKLTGSPSGVCGQPEWEVLLVL